MCIISLFLDFKNLQRKSIFDFMMQNLKVRGSVAEFKYLYFWGSFWSHAILISYPELQFFVLISNNVK